MEVDWSRYLESIRKEYAQWWKVYAFIDAVGRQRVEQEKGSLLFDFGLMVRTVQSVSEAEDEQESEGKEQVERLDVLEGLRKYASEYVLLVGRPGSGKSTALARLLLEEVEKAQQNPARKIPVLVELRYYQTSMLNLVRNFLKRHRQLLKVSDIEQLLFEGEFLLLIDGLNELPSEAARRNIKAFRQDYPETPMVFTTRDLGVGGDLDIPRKLEMQPLTETQMRQFIRQYLPQQGEQMLRQLGGRLRELGETPLLLKMLCDLFFQKEEIPSNLGSVFRSFAEQYDQKIKADVPIPDESRELWPDLLQHLALRMTVGNKPTEIQVAISRQAAEETLTQFLQQESFSQPRTVARFRLNDLLKHHLIQRRADNQIEFRHQLIQEYYAAEGLLKQILTLSDEQLKWDYLNYLKWTEPLALMLELIDQPALAKRMVKLALEVDWQLGARLAGSVKAQFQAQTLDLVTQRSIPQLLKIWLLGLTRSEASIPTLLKALNHEAPSIRKYAVIALGQIGSASTIPNLIQALQDRNSVVRDAAVSIFKEIATKASISDLFATLRNIDPNTRSRLTKILVSHRNELFIYDLLFALVDENSATRRKAVASIDKLESDVAIPVLAQVLQDEEPWVRETAADLLGKVGDDTSIPALLEALQDDEDTLVHLKVIFALGKSAVK